MPDGTLSDWLHRQAVLLPDGHHFLYSNLESVFVADLNDHPVKARKLMPIGMHLAYVPPGYLLFVREGVLLAQTFDATGLKLSGEPFPLVENIAQKDPRFMAEFSVSSTGVLAWREVGMNSFKIEWLNRQGSPIEALDLTARPAYLSLSPDGARLALVDRSFGGIGLGTIRVLDPERKTVSPLIAGNARQTGPPVWSPDGKRIAYAAYGDPVIYVKPVDGLEEPALLVRSSNVNMGADDWSHDGRFLVFSDQEARTGFDLWLLRLDGSHKPLPLLQTTHNEFGASASSK